MGCNISTAEENPDTLVEDFQESSKLKKPQKIAGGNNNHLTVQVNPNEYYGGSASKEEMEDLERRISIASARYQIVPKTSAISATEDSWWSKLFQRNRLK